jgi:vacuole morphology and inheritance protein 14
MIDKVSKPDILRDFLTSYIYEIKEDNAKHKYYYAENYIDGIYKKQNNNNGYVSSPNSDESKIAQALSHFSWLLTRGYLVVVDI